MAVAGPEARKVFLMRKRPFFVNGLCMAMTDHTKRDLVRRLQSQQIYDRYYRASYSLMPLGLIASSSDID